MVVDQVFQKSKKRFRSVNRETIEFSCRVTIDDVGGAAAKPRPLATAGLIKPYWFGTRRRSDAASPHFVSFAV
jgi:hypothetical protein